MVRGLRERMARIVSAKWAAPPSGRSSRLTDVTTACERPSSAAASATRPGSSGSSAPGRPLPTAQKPQWRVQTSPSSMNVAVRSRAQHSWMFGTASLLAHRHEREAAHHRGARPRTRRSSRGAPSATRAARGASRAAPRRAREAPSSRGDYLAAEDLAEMRRDGSREVLRTEPALPVQRSIEVTPPSVMPQGTMPAKWGSGSSVTFKAKPWVVIHRERWTPIAAILSLPTQTEVTRSRRSERDASMPRPARARRSDLLEVRDVALHVAAVGREVHDRDSRRAARVRGT